MDFTKLRYFAEVCRLGSMTRAADSLFVSQQNVSKAISSLESELGTTLFIRAGSTLKMTSDAEYLLQKAEWILAECRVVDRHFTEKKDRGDRIRLAASNALLSKFPRAAQNLILSDQSPFNISFLEMSSAQAEEAVSKGSMDFALTCLPTFSPDFDAVPLCTLSHCFIVNRHHPLAAADRVSPHQLAQYPMVIPDTSGVTGVLIDNYFSRIGVKPYIIVPTSNALEIADLVRNNDNFAGHLLLHDYEKMHTRDLSRLKMTVPLEPLTAALILKRKRPTSKTEKDFRKALSESFRNI